MKEAVRVSEEKHIWQSEDMALAMKRVAEYEAHINKTVIVPDVCVSIHTSALYSLDKPYTLDDMIRALQSQQNRNWRAVAFSTDTTPISHVFAGRMDYRIKEVPFHVPKDQKITAAQAYDLTLKNLTHADPTCWNAKYLLATNGCVEYAPIAFNYIVQSRAD